MTHRSRAGGPPKQAYSGKGKPKSGAAVARNGPRKLHHPPPSESLIAGPSRHPILDTPNDEEILGVIHSALEDTLDSEGFVPLVQKVKGLLYEKRWLDVFERPEEGWLEAYAGRWVPGRVLCFRDLLGSVPEVRQMLQSEHQDVGTNGNVTHSDEDGSDGDEDGDTSGGSSEGEGPAAVANGDAKVEDLADGVAILDVDDKLSIVSLGGGAGSEYLAVAALLAGIRSHSGKGKERAVQWTGVDLGAWDGVLDSFQRAISTKWDLPLEMEYIRMNLLDSLASSDTTLDGTAVSIRTDKSLPDVLRTRRPDLITLLYTLTELFTQSRPLTLSLLSSLAECPAGTLLLVADSASDISEFPIGKEGRTWPVYMILDMILLRGSPPAWEVVEKSNSRWYRLPPGVGATWRVKVENTRYWYRLYRRL